MQRFNRDGIPVSVRDVAGAVRGRLILGADDLFIEAGETVEFSTWTPHWFGAADGPVEAIMIFGPHSERVHLHA